MLTQKQRESTIAEPSYEVLQSENLALHQRVAALEMRVAALQQQCPTVPDSEARYRAFLSAFPDLMIRISNTGVFLDYQAGNGRDLLLIPDDFIGKHLSDVLSPHLTAQTLQCIQRAIERDEVQCLDYHLMVQEKMRYFEARFAAINTSEVLIIVRNMTEHRDLTEAVQQARTELERLIASVPVVLWSVEYDAEGDYLQHYVSPTTGLVLGQPAPYMADSHEDWLKMVHPDDQVQARELAQGCLLGQVQDADLEYRIVKPDGTVRWIHDRVTVRTGSNGQRRLEGVASDITARKEMEQALRAANAQLHDWVRELERRNREITLLNEMGDFLQSCQDIEEAYGIIAQFANDLFANQAGGMCLFRSVHTVVEPVATWGQPRAQLYRFPPEQCWALRRGQVHLFVSAETDIRCRHLDEGMPGASVCAPLIAQGNTLGILYVYLDSQQSPERYVQLAGTVASQCALALTNIQLRARLCI